MGFIAQRGSGTEEILVKLYQTFFLHIEDTAANCQDLFKPGKSLADAAQAMKLWPTDGGHRGKWMKWLLWLNRHAPKHEHMLLLLFNALQARQPCILDGQEDAGANPNTPPRVVTGTAQLADGRRVGVLTVITCTADKIPDAPA
jgi:hypothetical protein